MRKHYRAPNAQRRTVRICTDAPAALNGKRTGAVKLAAYGYAHLAHLLGVSEREVRELVAANKLRFDCLASVVALCMKSPQSRRRIKELADGSAQLKLVNPAPQTRRRRSIQEAPHVNLDS